MDGKLLPGVTTRKRERQHARLKDYAILSTWTLLAIIILYNHRILTHSHYLWKGPFATTLEYPGERITWVPCGDFNSRPLECSSISVPLDHFTTNPSSDPPGFKIPLVRLRGKNATQNLLLNPGGPGGSGFEFLHRRGKQLTTILGEGFHLLTFDPRGVNSSTPTASCYPDPAARKAESQLRARDAEADSPEIYAWAQNFAKACPDTMGAYAPYINTPQTAADMNSILDAVGQQDMLYWGFSYGSILGQTYAGLFPSRAKRVIIDGVSNVFEWYEGVGMSESLTDTDRVVDGFFEECIKAGADRCALASLATRAEELRERIFAFLAELRKQPLAVYVNKTVHGILDYDTLWYNGVFPATYRTPLWYDLARNLYSLINGNATDAFLAYEAEYKRDESNEFVTYNDGLTGPQHWPQDKDLLLAQITPWLNQSLFSTTFLVSYYQKQQWRVPRTHPYVPRRGVETAHPLLILSTTYDPVCPLVSARVANEAFVGSRIVEIEGYGHCSVAVASVCAAKHVRAFLYEGVLPDAYTRCKVDSAYFVKLEEDESVAAQTDFEDSEDRYLHLAQLELMAGWDVPGPLRW